MNIEKELKLVEEKTDIMLSEKQNTSEYFIAISSLFNIFSILKVFLEDEVYSLLI